jgi:hypothetical protein
MRVRPTDIQLVAKVALQEEWAVSGIDDGQNGGQQHEGRWHFSDIESERCDVCC